MAPAGMVADMAPAGTHPVDMAADMARALAATAAAWAQAAAPELAAAPVLALESALVAPVQRAETAKVAERRSLCFPRTNCPYLYPKNVLQTRG